MHFLGITLNASNFTMGIPSQDIQSHVQRRLANLDLYRRRNLLQTIKQNSSLPCATIKEVSKLPIVSRLRHRGLLAAFELHKNMKPIRFMQNKEPIQYYIMRESMKMGVFLRSLGNTMIVIPPLAIPRRDLRTLLDVQFVSCRRLNRRASSQFS